jgi:hypothetical protein
MMRRHILPSAMRYGVSLLAVAVIAQTATADADDFAHIDPVMLAKSIEKLGEAWSIETVAIDNATDDFAEDDLFKAAAPEESEEAPRGGTSREAELERVLLDLGTGKEDSYALRRIGRQ